MIVVDTNIVIYLFVSNTQTEYASATMTKDSDWFVPSIWQSEFRNALLTYVRHKIIDLPQAKQLMNQALTLLEAYTYAPNSELVMDLAIASGCSAYDTEFVALAKLLNLQLITADKKILHEFPETAVSPQQFIT